MTPAQAAYLSRNVPRYTSYPTAPNFSTGIGPATYATWLAQIDPSDPVSLYLHVPYCRALCWYCGCNMKLARRAKPLSDYAATLRDEIALVFRHLPGRMPVSHLHWGGGTPTALDPDDLALTMDDLHAHFDIRDTAELAIESDPRTLSDEMIARIGELGFTRASFGVQEFDPTVQAAINRVQPPEMVERAVTGLRQAGVAGINFDLIYGLPHQTVETLLATIDRCVTMRPDRIALFGYAHVPWMARKQRLIDATTLPDTAARLAQSRAASRALAQAGYHPIGLDHFARLEDPMAQAARNGTLRRNFQGYTTDHASTMLGLGASSIGRTPAGYAQNLSETGAWARAVTAGTLPVGKGLALTSPDRLRGAVIEALMCQGAADLDALGARHGAPARWYQAELPALDTLVRDGLLVRDAGLIRATAAGAPLRRVIAATFDSYLPQTTARHAVAV